MVHDTSSVNNMIADHVKTKIQFLLLLKIFCLPCKFVFSHRGIFILTLLLLCYIIIIITLLLICYF